MTFKKLKFFGAKIVPSCQKQNRNLKHVTNT